MDGPFGPGVGMWRSLVAHLTGGQGVAGSNPVIPTNFVAVNELRESRETEWSERTLCLHDSLDQHFQHFLRERIYLHNIAPKTLSGIGTRGRSSNGALANATQPASTPRTVSPAPICRSSSSIFASAG